MTEIYLIILVVVAPAITAFIFRNEKKYYVIYKNLKREVVYSNTGLQIIKKRIFIDGKEYKGVLVIRDKSEEIVYMA